MSEGESTSSATRHTLSARQELLRGVPEEHKKQYTVLTAEDKFEISELINTFVQCIDSNDKSTFADLFTDDGVCEVRKTSKKIHGHSALTEFCGQLHQTFLGCTHWETNIVIRGAENQTAVNYSYWMSIKSNSIQATGAHQDVFVKEKSSTTGKSAWKILHRNVFHHPIVASGNASAPITSSLLSVVAGGSSGSSSGSGSHASTSTPLHSIMSAAASSVTPGAGPPLGSGEKEPTEESEEPGGGEGEGKGEGKPRIKD